MENRFLGISIEHAKSLVPHTNVFVSTDSQDIANVATNFGAQVIMRPPELAQDNSPELLAWCHALDTLKARGQEVKIFISLPCTCPLRRAADVVKGVDLFMSSNADIVVSIMQAYRNPWFNMLKKLMVRRFLT